MLRTRSVSSPIDRQADGLRLLVTRFRGRGLPANRYDVWMPSLGPSEALVRKYLSGGMTWPSFAREYRRELFLGGDVDKRNRTIKNHGEKFTLRLLAELARRGPVTLLCHCAEDTAECHRHELRRLVEKEM